MFANLFKKNSIPKIARTIPIALVDEFDKQTFYTPKQVKDVFNKEFKYEHNLDYAYAMFCTKSDFEKLNLNSDYQALRKDISKSCFGNWPRFNFESLLFYAKNRQGMGGEGGFFSDAGCGDGGGGGE
ncbi:DUF6559 family protein [Parashewanella tropica]|uniref:DUF6559 family protein n=1 Tax=Parashewanella tropica TaxID=2547970 RepID=UPI001059A042|nr:DUF6559 family protein [Parashewanella tropica]